MTDPQDYVGLHKLPTSDSCVDPKALVGLEVEVENVLRIDSNLTLGFWSVHEDGSLRNNGREFKTPAIPTQYVKPALFSLASCLNDTIDFSQRTSIHVHQDVRGMRLEQVLTLLFAYTPLENLLFKFAGTSRKSSVYCVPLVDTNLLERLFESNDDFYRVLRGIGNYWQKYTALNLMPIAEFGTVEYRHMPGHLNITKLCLWVELLSCLKLYAYKTPYQQALNEISDLNTTSAYSNFVKSVFGDLHSVLDMSNLVRDMEEGVYQVKNCGAGNTFHTSVMSGFSNDSDLAKFLGIDALVKKLGTELYRDFILFCSRLALSHGDPDANMMTFLQMCDHRDAYMKYVIDHTRGERQEWCKEVLNRLWACAA